MSQILRLLSVTPHGVEEVEQPAHVAAIELLEGRLVVLPHTKHQGDILVVTLAVLVIVHVPRTLCLYNALPAMI
jgi:hypothetical protein